MPRYIDADALIEKIQETVCTKCGDIYDGIKCKSCEIDDTLNFLQDAPTADVVKVVRCKDCVYYMETEGYEYKGRNARHCFWYNRLVREKDYCSDGIRRKGE